MDYSKLFLSSFGSGDAPLVGDEIKHSLRFKGSSRTFTRTAATTTETQQITISFWYKSGQDASDRSVLIADNSAGFFLSQLYNNNNDDDVRAYIGTNETSGGSNITYSAAGFGSAVDPTAWVHYFAVYNSQESQTDDRMKLYLNGVLQAFNTSDTFYTTVPFNESIRYLNQATHEYALGDRNGDHPFSGYIAEMHFIDGKALKPTAFGRFNASGVWVPVKPDFSQSAVKKYSDYLFSEGDTDTPNLNTTESNFSPDVASAKHAFNGDVDTFANSFSSPTPGNWIIFRPDTPIVANSSVEFSSVYPTQTILVNGVDTGISTSHENTVVTTSLDSALTFPVTIESIAFRGGTSAGGLYNCRLNDIRIDGVPLQDPDIWSQYLSTDNPGGFQEPATNAFNGVTTDPACMSGNTGGTLTWAPPSFEFKEKIEVYCKAGLTSANYIAAWNGNEVNYAHDTWVTVYEGEGVIDNSFPLTITADPSDQAALAAVRIDGTIVTDGVSTDYGPNGFHLDFSDPYDLGADRSGNGNDWTVSGFDTTYPGSWSDAVTTNKSWNDTLAPYTAGESDYIWLGNCSSGDCDDATYVFEPSSPINLYGNTLRLGTGGTSYNQTKFKFTFDDSSEVELDWQANASATTFQDVKTGNVGLVKMEMIYDGPYSTGSNHGGLTGLWLGDNKLVNTRGDGYDHMTDSPTHNWATLNSLKAASTNGSSYNPVFVDANLGNLKSGSNNGVKTTIQVDSDVYFEYISPTSAYGNGYGGLNFNDSSDSGSGSTLGNAVYVLEQNRLAIAGTDFNSYITPTPSTNAVVGIQYDFTNVRVRASADGVFGEWIDVTTYIPDASTSAIYGYFQWGYNPVTNVTASFNFGQQPWLYAPDGVTAETHGIQTQNLPKPEVVYGGDHFRVLTGTGSSILAAAQGQTNGDNGTGFQRALWWIKSRGDGNNQLLDSLRGGDKILYSDGSNPESTYSTPTSDSVAWCWKAGESVVTNNDGDIESQVSANTDAGFSIAKWQRGTDTTATIGHGLNSPPEFIISKAIDTSENWSVYHVGAGNNGRLRLNDTTAFDTSSGSQYWNNTTPGNSVFTVGNGINTNQTNDMIAYCWHSVPGYSKIGGYVGNGNNDGPVIDCGFKPAYIMTKRVDSTSNWFILDASRNTYNPLYQWLEANEATQEQNNQVPNYTVDFVSNGFKIRGTGDVLNVIDGNYIYIAFAQHPRGGAGLGPAAGGHFGVPQYDGILPGIANSLRFRGAQYLSHPGQTSTSSSLWTWSGWVKRGKLGVTQPLVDGYFNGTNFSKLGFSNDGNLLFYNFLAGADHSSDTVAVFNDTGAWYHIMFVYDSNNAIVSDRGIWYVNGERQPYNSIYGDIALGEGCYLNNNYPQSIGRQVDSSLFFDGYMADVYLIDGQSLEPTDFGDFDSNGVWKPIETNISDYGTNGFHLIMDPAYQSGNTLRDQSGNGNDWTVSGVESGDFYSADFDYMKDGPTENYATLNPLFSNGSTTPGTLSNGNLQYNSFSFKYKTAAGTIGLKTGKYYWEQSVTSLGSSPNPIAGIIRGTTAADNTYVSYDPNGNVYGFGYGYEGRMYGDQQSGGVGVTSGAALTTGLAAYDVGDIIGIAADIPNGTLDWYKNNTLVYSLTDIGAGTIYDWMPAVSGYDETGWEVNFGQRAFVYTPPVGFEALQTKNLPEAPITKGSDHFTPVLFPYTQQTISGLDFAPDLVWLKVRNNSWNHRLYDTVRGPLERLESNNNGQENGGGTDSDGVNSFTSDGFTHLGLGASGSDEYVAWCWKAGGAAVANTDGDIDSQVSANTDAGFSIVTYTGNDAASATIGHGLNSEPEFVIVKARNADKNWTTYHASISAGTQNCLELNNSVPTANVQGPYFGATQTFNNDVFSVGFVGGDPSNSTNVNGNDYVAYCWHSVPGFSATGTFNGNASAEGPFVYLGFRPAWIMFKSTNNPLGWQIVDTTRDTSNTTTSRVLQANADDIENTNMLDYLDILSNGFKVRDPAGFNQNGWEIAYVAFAENPSNISNAR